jgi:hypothetical protein
MIQKPTIKIKRLNFQNAKTIQIQQVPVSGEEWTTECLIDELFLCLCRTKEEITIDRGFYVNGQRSVRILTVRKYYRRARLEVLKWIQRGARPTPDFIINVNDLAPKIVQEIESIACTPATLHYVLTQAVGRIFENLDFESYHFLVARNLKVRLES